MNDYSRNTSTSCQGILSRVTRMGGRLGEMKGFVSRVTIVSSRQFCIEGISISFCVFAFKLFDLLFFRWIHAISLWGKWTTPYCLSSASFRPASHSKDGLPLTNTDVWFLRSHTTSVAANRGRSILGHRIWAWGTKRFCPSLLPCGSDVCVDIPCSTVCFAPSEMNCRSPVVLDLVLVLVLVLVPVLVLDMGLKERDIIIKKEIWRYQY